MPECINRSFHESSGFPLNTCGNDNLINAYIVAATFLRLCSGQVRSPKGNVEN